jgi:hypothetical protein
LVNYINESLKCLYVSTDGGGARGPVTEYYFSQNNGLHSLVYFTGMDAGIGRVIKDPTGIALPPIINVDFRMVRFAGIPHGGPDSHVYFRKVGGNYVDVTPEFPAKCKAEIGECKAYVEMMNDGERLLNPNARKIAALGYLINAIAIKKEPEAWVWLKANVPASLYTWLEANKAALRRRLTLPDGIYVTLR